VDWQNRTYVLDDLGPVAVRQGAARFQLTEDNQVVPPPPDGSEGANGMPGGSYQVSPPLFADIDGDGVEDAVISSVLSTGGTGHFSQVQVYTVRGGQVVELGAIPGGDRGDGGIRRVVLDDRAVIVDRNVLAEGDGVCCASQAQRERWIWRSGQLVEDLAVRQLVAP
jgi:hypothetical protein